jgi:hypothetical protein
VNLDLDWSDQFSVMERIVDRVADGIRIHKLDLVMAADAINCYLVPKLNSVLQVILPPATLCSRWDTRLRHSALQAAGMKLRRNINVEAFYVVSGAWSRAAMLPVIGVSEVMARLNSRQDMVSRTAWARMASCSSTDRALPTVPTVAGDRAILYDTQHGVTPMPLNRIVQPVHGFDYELVATPEPWYSTPVRVVHSADCIWSCDNVAPFDMYRDEFALTVSDAQVCRGRCLHRWIYIP